MPTRTVLDLLTQPNDPVRNTRSGTTLTWDHTWDHIEALELWDDFTFAKLSQRFRRQLAAKISTVDWKKYINDAGLNVAPSEKWLNAPFAGHYADINNSLKSNSHSGQPRIGDGSEFWSQPGGPDLGVIINGVAYVVGDLKLGWSASTAVQGWKPKDYFAGRQKTLLAPVQQVQHYMRKLDLRYGFVISETEVIVLYGELGQQTEPKSPRPQRQTYRHSYASMDSDLSGLTSSVGGLSLQEIAKLNYRIIPWTRHGSNTMTCGLALFFISLLALEEHRLVAVDGQSQKSTQETPIAQTTQTSGQIIEKELPFESQGRVARPVLLEFLLPQILKDAKLLKKKNSSFIYGIPTGSEAGLMQVYAKICDLSESNMDAFVPGAGIDRSIIETRIGTHVPNAYFLHEDTRNGKEGYLISIPKTQRDTMKEALENLIRESRPKRQKR